MTDGPRKETRKDKNTSKERKLDTNSILILLATDTIVKETQF